MKAFLILVLAVLSLSVVPTVEASRRQRQVVVQKQVVQPVRQRVVVQRVVQPVHVQQVRVQRVVQQNVVDHCDSGVLQLNGGSCSQFFLGNY